ncbi:Cullin repeat-containing protein [Dendrothele bispora CBS 962.96]|uniref:Cullin repeat-containing protein n=1 Tax=Dendrothele bispora (strain CBS 962.96) TaxID=1314807 RepID=A0A4S8MH09_DENBC|nr:Cullin repeat-containing protein [Dendrothele bispora CBS 962.96]
MSLLPPMPPHTADIDKQWSYLCLGLDQAMSGAPRSSSDYMQIYTTVWNIVTASKNQKNQAKNNSGVSEHEGVRKSREVLYNRLKNYFSEYLTEIKEKSLGIQDPEALLKYYSGEWNQYVDRTKYISQMCSYLNRYWVKAIRDENRRAKGRKKEVYKVDSLALVQWKRELLLPLQTQNNKLTTAVISLINQERDGKTIDQDLVRKVLSSYISLDIDKEWPEYLDVYKSHFVAPFLHETEFYYRGRLSSLPNAHNEAEHIQETLNWLREEEIRVDSYLCADEKTRREIISGCESVITGAWRSQEHEDYSG